MVHCSSFSDLARRHNDPLKPSEGRLNGAAYQARVAIPDYCARLRRHYGPDTLSALKTMNFQHFGFEIEFNTPVELSVHDDVRRLDGGLRTLVGRYGPVVIRNARMPAQARRSDQRNIFKSLDFHIDRGKNQEDHFSMFWRDPDDPEQCKPRNSSTLILPYQAAYAQAIKEGQGGGEFKPGYTLFKDEDVAPLTNEILFELPWRAPETVGEIAVLDNLEVLHASYYRRPEDRGYPISVRYLL